MNSHTYYCLCVCSLKVHCFFCVAFTATVAAEKKMHFIFTYEFMTTLLFYYFILPLSMEDIIVIIDR